MQMRHPEIVYRIVEWYTNMTDLVVSEENCMLLDEVQTVTEKIWKEHRNTIADAKPFLLVLLYHRPSSSILIFLLPFSSVLVLLYPRPLSSILIPFSLFLLSSP